MSTECAGRTALWWLKTLLVSVVKVKVLSLVCVLSGLETRLFGLEVMLAGFCLAYLLVRARLSASLGSIELRG